MSECGWRQHEWLTCSAVPQLPRWLNECRSLYHLTLSTDLVDGTLLLFLECLQDLQLPTLQVVDLVLFPGDVFDDELAHYFATHDLDQGLLACADAGGYYLRVHAHLGFDVRGHRPVLMAGLSELNARGWLTFDTTTTVSSRRWSFTYPIMDDFPL